MRVENVGAEPEYVRARLRMTSVAPDGSSADASGNVAFNVNAGEGPRGSMAAMGGTTTADWLGVAACSTPAP